MVTPATGMLRIQPRVDVTLAEPPLPAHTDSGQFARLDQAIDRPEIDLQVVNDFVGREERLVHHHRVRRRVRPSEPVAVSGVGAAGSVIVSNAPPDTEFAAVNEPPWS